MGGIVAIIGIAVILSKKVYDYISQYAKKLNGEFEVVEIQWVSDLDENGIPMYIRHQLILWCPVRRNLMKPVYSKANAKIFAT